MLQNLRQGAGYIINARGRRPLHVLEGLALCAGALVLAGALGARTAPTRANPKLKAQDAMLDKPAIAPRARDMGALWGPMFLVLALSGLRVWNAPSSPARTRALSLWGLLQGLHSIWALLGPTRQTGQLVAAAGAMGAGGAYLYEARKVDATSAADQRCAG